MLTMLEYIEKKDCGTVKNIIRKLRGDEISARVEHAMNTSFVRIRAERGANPRRLESFNQDVSLMVLMPKADYPPPETILRRFKPVHFPRRLLENLALDALLQSDKLPREKRIAVLGSETELCSYMPKLAPLVGEMRIITGRPHALSDAAEQLRNDFGVDVIITNNPNVKGFPLVVAPNGLCKAFETDESCVLLSPEKPKTPYKLWVSECVCSLPAELESAYKRGYDITEVTAAFYEQAGVRKLGDTLPKYGVAEGKKVSASFISELI